MCVFQAALIMTQTPEGMKGLAAARGGRGGKTMRGRGKGRGGANLKKSPEIGKTAEIFMLKK